MRRGRASAYFPFVFLFFPSPPSAGASESSGNLRKFQGASLSARRTRLNPADRSCSCSEYLFLDIQAPAVPIFEFDGVSNAYTKPTN